MRPKIIPAAFPLQQMLKRATQRSFGLHEDRARRIMSAASAQIVTEELGPLFRRVVHMPVLFHLTVRTQQHHQELVLIADTVRLGAAELCQNAGLFLVLQVLDTTEYRRLRLTIAQALHVRAQPVVPHHRAVFARGY